MATWCHSWCHDDGTGVVFCRSVTPGVIPFSWKPCVSRGKASRRGLFLIHWLQVRVLDGPPETASHFRSAARSGLAVCGACSRTQVRCAAPRHRDRLARHLETDLPFLSSACCLLPLGVALWCPGFPLDARLHGVRRLPSCERRGPSWWAHSALDGCLLAWSNLSLTSRVGGG